MAQLDMEQTIAGFLKAIGVEVPHGYIRRHVKAHNDESSMACITDLLDTLNITHAAIAIDQEQLTMLPEPYLAYTTADGGDFIIINDTKEYLASHPDFYNHWNGLVIAAEKPETINRTGFKEFEEGAKWRTVFMVTSILLLAAAAVNLCIHVHLLWAMLVLAGVGIGFLIKGKSWGVNNTVADKLCSALGNHDCDTVIKSSGSRLWGWLELSDCVCIYFGAQLLFGRVDYSLLIAAMLAVPVTIYSLYYQAVNKQWCALCLLVDVVIWAQAVFLMWLQPMGIGMFAGMVTVAALIVFLVNRLVVNHNRYQYSAAQLQRFKTNPEFLLSRFLLDAVYSVPPAAIRLGNAEAPLQLTIVCAPYCAPCASLHHLLDDLLAFKGHQFGLHICFNYTGQEIILQLLQAIKERDAYTVLKQWFSDMNPADFDMPYSADCLEAARLQRQWCAEMQITHTPTLFVNGQLLQSPYNFYDLPVILPVLINQVEEMYQSVIQ